MAGIPSLRPGFYFREIPVDKGFFLKVEEMGGAVNVGPVELFFRDSPSREVEPCEDRHGKGEEAEQVDQVPHGLVPAEQTKPRQDEVPVV